MFPRIKVSRSKLIASSILRVVFLADIWTCQSRNSSKCPSPSCQCVSMNDTRELELAHLNGLSQSFSCFDKSKSLQWKVFIVCALAKET